MTTEEMLLQLIEGQKRTDEHFKQIDKRFDKIEKDISDIKEDIADIKEEAEITRHVLNRHGEILERMIKDLEPLNLLNVKYE